MSDKDEISKMADEQQETVTGEVFENQQTTIINYQQLLQQDRSTPVHAVALSDVKEGTKALVELMAGYRKFPFCHAAKYFFKACLFLFYLVNFVYSLVIFVNMQPTA